MDSRLEPQCQLMTTSICLYQAQYVCEVDITESSAQTELMAGKPLYEAFGSAVSTRRKALGLTQAELAGKVKMSRASIANIESGRQNILLHHVYALAAALEFAKVSDLLPPAPQKPLVGEGLKMTVSNQSLSKQTLSQNAEAQVADLITTALQPKRGKA